MSFNLALGFSMLALLSTACSTVKKNEQVATAPLEKKAVRVCESGQITTLKQDISVTTKEQPAVVVKAGSQVHIIDKSESGSKVTYKVYVGQDGTGQMISGLGIINETGDIVLACQKLAAKN